MRGALPPRINKHDLEDLSGWPTSKGGQCRLCLGRPSSRTRSIISRSRFEDALVYKPLILSLKNEEFPNLVHKLSVI